MSISNALTFKAKPSIMTKIYEIIDGNDEVFDLASFMPSYKSKRKGSKNSSIVQRKKTIFTVLFKTKTTAPIDFMKTMVTELYPGLRIESGWCCLEYKTYGKGIYQSNMFVTEDYFGPRAAEDFTYHHIDEKGEYTEDENADDGVWKSKGLLRRIVKQSLLDDFED
jgi:hypothetical protein